jgi:hypothetical protein
LIHKFASHGKDNGPALNRTAGERDISGDNHVAGSEVVDDIIVSGVEFSRYDDGLDPGP